MRFEFTRHARERCRERGVRISDVKMALRHLDRAMPIGDGLIQTSKKVRGKILVVIFKTERDKRIIITAYYEN